MKANIKRLLIILTAIMFGSFLVSAIVYFAMGGQSSVLVNAGQVRTLKDFPAQGIKDISIYTVNTNINIIPVPEKNIQVDFYGNVITRVVPKMPELSAYQESGTLFISIDNPNAIVPGFINVSPLVLDVYIPQEFSEGINVETISGNLIISKLKLDSFDFKSLSGRLEADSVSASDISIKSTSGKLDLSNTEGNIDINSLSGEITLSMESFKDDLNIKTISGSVTLTLPGESGFDFSFSSISGRIENEFGSQIRFADGRKVEGTVGQGANKLIVNSTSGNIKVKKGQ